MTCVTVEELGTEVISDRVDETVLLIQDTGVTVLDLDLDLTIGAVAGGTVIEVGTPATTTIDVYGGPEGPPGPTRVSADAYNVAYIGTDGLLYVPEKARMSLDLEVDESDSVALGYVYVGEAPPGTATSVAGWRIKRISDTGTTTSIEWADGAADSTHIWDDRKTLTYGP